MPWIDLDEVKDHLNKTNSNDDDELQGFLEAACAVIEDLKGHVDPVATSGVYAARVGADTAWPFGCRFFLYLPEAPVLSVQAVASVVGNGTATAVPSRDAVAGTDGWELSGSLLYVASPGLYQVTYTVGRNPVPANYRLAALELAAHLWRGSQLNQSSGRPPIAGDQMMVLPQIASALPYRVRELLGLYGEIVAGQIG